MRRLACADHIQSLVTARTLLPCVISLSHRLWRAQLLLKEHRTISVTATCEMGVHFSRLDTVLGAHLPTLGEEWLGIVGLGRIANLDAGRHPVSLRETAHIRFTFG